MRVASFNVLAPEWGDETVTGPNAKASRRRARIAGALTKIDADVLFMQEVTLPVRRLVKKLGYRELVQRRTVLGHSPITVIYAHRRLEVKIVQRILCRRVFGYAQPMVKCEINGHLYVLCGIHFEYNDLSKSKEQFDTIVSCINIHKRGVKRAIVAGDFNMESQHISANIKRLGLRDIVHGRPTHPNKSEAEMSITKILVSAQLARNASNVHMLREPSLAKNVRKNGSDHFPVFVDI